MLVEQEYNLQFGCSVKLLIKQPVIHKQMPVIGNGVLVVISNS